MNEGMDAEIFAQFHEQLERYVRERLIPAEPEVIAHDKVPDDILAEMKDMGLFGLTVPEDHGGAGLNTAQYARIVNTMAYAAPAFRSIFSINVGMFNSAIKNGGTEAQKAEWWPRIAAGEVACFGLTEPGSGLAKVAMAALSDPLPGSVRPKQAIAPSAIFGHHSAFCASVPPFLIAELNMPTLIEKMLRKAGAA